MSGVDYLDPRAYGDQIAEALAERARRLMWIREDPRERLPPLIQYYKAHPADFIHDWGMTFEVRNPEVGLPAAIPFLLFPRQREWVDWVMDMWRLRRPGVTEKSRDCGISWLAVALGCTLGLHYDGINIGYGSRKEEYVDKSNAPKALFVRARQFLSNLPPEFRGGWTPACSSHMHIRFPNTQSTLSGEAGDNVGRGDRAAIYFYDESAHAERPQLIEASLSQTTNCRIDISSANGTNNPFYEKVISWPKSRVFRFHWRDDPRKDDEWYARQVEDLDPVTVAQEIDINYQAAIEGVLIPSEWVQAAVDAHHKLKIRNTGERRGALDVADEGRDKLAFASAKGILLDFLEEWSGKGSDIFYSVEKTFDFCDELGLREFTYDADGLGAGVRGDARVLNEARSKRIEAAPFRGSGAVHRPEGEDFKGRKNQDYFTNAKAQAYMALRKRFQTTYRAITKGTPYNPDDIISLSSQLPNLTKLQAELSQPTYKLQMGKILVNKQPDGARSPNLADSVMILFAARQGKMTVSDAAVRATA